MVAIESEGSLYKPPRKPLAQCVLCISIVISIILSAYVCQDTSNHTLKEIGFIVSKLYLVEKENSLTIGSTVVAWVE